MCERLSSRSHQMLTKANVLATLSPESWSVGLRKIWICGNQQLNAGGIGINCTWEGNCTWKGVSNVRKAADDIAWRLYHKTQNWCSRSRGSDFLLFHASKEWVCVCSGLISVWRLHGVLWEQDSFLVDQLCGYRYPWCTSVESNGLRNTSVGIESGTEFFGPMRAVLRILPMVECSDWWISWRQPLAFLNTVVAPW